MRARFADMNFPDPKNIEAARSAIDPVFLDMPEWRSVEIDRLTGAEIVFKDETANPIRSFKGRGTGWFADGLPDGAALVCASAGNFGQGLAWAARRRGLELTVIAATGAVASKVAAMRALGARVLSEGRDFDAAKDAARAFAATQGALYVEDGAEARIAEGAGTLAAEMSTNGTYDAIIVPLGNGALASGVGCWMKHAAPATRVIGVAALGAPAMARSVERGVIVETANVATIADGIAVRVPIPYAVEAVRRVVDEVLLVGDDPIRRAMGLLKDALGLVVEPAGAAGFAALLSDPPRWRGQRIAVPLCGGNI